MLATRVLLIGLGPELASRLRAAFANADDLVVVGEEAKEVPLLVRANEADVVIVGRSDETVAAMAERLIDENPALAVVALDRSVEHARIHRLQHTYEDIALDDAAALVGMLRRMAVESYSETNNPSTSRTQTRRERP